MKKGLFSLLFIASSLFAVSGGDVYTQHCAACHQIKGPMGMAPMKAPPMNMVSMRIKMVKGNDKKAFVAFVKDYIVNPSQDKGVCMPMAYKRFGTMPPIGKGLSVEERDAVAQWLYDNFKGSWKNSMGGKMCESNDMKNASGKCGGQGNNGMMRCGSGKCGGQNKKSMKCGSGKCGGN